MRPELHQAESDFDIILSNDYCESHPEVFAAMLIASSNRAIANAILEVANRIDDISSYLDK